MSSSRVKIEPCPKEHLHGRIDIDSCFVLVENLEHFVPDPVMKFHLCNPTVDFTQNKKATRILKAVDRCEENHIYKEFRLIGSGTKTIYVLLCLKQFKEVEKNVGQLFVQEVVFPAFDSQPDQSETKKQLLPLHCLTASIKSTTALFKNDWGAVMKSLLSLSQIFLKNHRDIHKVYYYRCVHNLKTDVGTGLLLLKEIGPKLKVKAKLIQLHFGLTINPPENCAIVLDYQALEKSLRTKNFVRQNNYFLKDCGFFHGADDVAFDLDYIHSYNTIDHQIKLKRQNLNIFTLLLCNGLNKDFYNFKVAREKCTCFLYQLKNWFTSITSNRTDLRMEAVKSYLYTSTDSFNVDHFPLSWSATETVPLNMKQFEFVIFLDSLIKHKAFMIIRNWINYAEASIGSSLQRLHSCLMSSTGIKIFKEDYVKLYMDEQQILKFIHGSEGRYDSEFMQPLELHEVHKPVVSFKVPLPTFETNFFQTRQTTFSFLHHKTAEYLEFLYDNSFVRTCEPYFDVNDTIYYKELKDEELIKELLIRFAMARNMLLKKQRPNRRYYEDIGAFFSSDKTAKLTASASRLISVQEVCENIRNPKLLLLNLIRLHVCDKEKFDEKLFRKKLRKFVKIHIKSWPSFFVDPTQSRKDWYIVQCTDIDILRTKALKRKFPFCENVENKKKCQYHVNENIDELNTEEDNIILKHVLYSIKIKGCFMTSKNLPKLEKSYYQMRSKALSLLRHAKASEVAKKINVSEYMAKKMISLAKPNS
ncbi:hypothetical protein TKK_0011682 [Trichogramma kaykai]